METRLHLHLLSRWLVVLAGKCGSLLLDTLLSPLAGSLGLRTLGVHLCLELVDVRRVAFERGANLLLEVVDDNEVGEEWEDVFYLEQIGVLEEAHCPR